MALGDICVTSCSCINDDHFHSSYLFTNLHNRLEFSFTQISMIIFELAQNSTIYSKPLFIWVFSEQCVMFV